MGGRDQIAVRSQLRQIVCKRHYLENTQHKKRAVGKCKALSSNPNTTKKKKKKKPPLQMVQEKSSHYFHQKQLLKM
jgi:hypothetical protein